MAEQAKHEYLRFWMVDFIEMSMRRVAVDNTRFCARQCNLFSFAKSGITDQMSPLEELNYERKEMSCFEKCLGKHTDSFEIALNQWRDHLHS